MRSLAGSLARVAILSCATWAGFSVTASVEHRGVGLLSEQEKVSIVASDPAAPTPCYTIAALVCSATRNDGNLTTCGLASPPNCANNSSEGACSGDNISYECYQSASGGISKCPTFISLDGVTNCGYEETGGGCAPQNGSCVGTPGTIIRPRVDCGLVNSKQYRGQTPVCVKAGG